MENATKALLIAAAVLIAIALIALGVNLLNAGGDASGKAGEIGGILESETQGVADSAIGEICYPNFGNQPSWRCIFCLNIKPSRSS